MTAWVQLIISTDFDQADWYCDQLESLGAASITFMDAADQPLYEPPPGSTILWQATKLIALFDTQTDMKKIIRELQMAVHPATMPPWRVEHLEDKNWEKEWMKNFHPMQFGEKLWICPSWHEVPDPKACNIMLDPGMAFGTGTHPTTSMCLKWLDQNLNGGENIIDYGCGSGILAIAALKLGANRAWGIDHDPQALLATQINASNNGVLDKLIINTDNSKLPVVDIVVANILANPLLELAQTLATLVKPGGSIVLSGILDNQAETIEKRYKTWFTIADIQKQDEWVCLQGVKHS